MNTSASLYDRKIVSVGHFYRQKDPTYHYVDFSIIQRASGHKPSNHPYTETSDSTSDAAPLVRLPPRNTQRDGGHSGSKNDAHECLLRMDG